MFSPANRLLWLTFWLAVPALTLAGIDPASRIFVVLFFVLAAAVLVFDAVRLTKLVDQVQLTTAEKISAYKDRSGSVSVAVQFPAALHETQIALKWPVGFDVGEIGATSISFIARVRGEFSITEAYLSAASPWRLWKLRAQRRINLTIQVFPDLGKDSAARKLFATFQQGQRVQRIVGRGREVERLREYAAGDSFDEIYWKATARRGSPVSKVFQVERTQDIYAIVDGSRLGNRNQALERFVTASLLLAVAAEKNADNFGLVTFSNRVQDFVRASHGKGHFQRCREAIFALQPAPVSPDFAELFTFLNLRIRKRALLFFLTDLSDPLLSETFARDAAFVARRHIVMVNQIADAGDRPLFTGALPSSDTEVQSRLAGHLQWAKLRELGKGLSHIGIHMQLLKPEQASADLITQYMSIKQRQLL
jgi:uncharacterized protein (DUF58 family)